MSQAPDVAVVGGGMLGCAAGAFLAGAGARVELYERGELAGAASGRNSGALQYPFDPVLARLHAETLELLTALDGFELPERPAGVLMLGRDAEALTAVTAEIGSAFPELEPALLEGAALRQLEPLLADGLVACRLESGYPVRPASATLAFARRAQALGAELHEGAPARPWIEDGRLRGVVTADGVRRPAGAVLVAAGPWTPELVDASGSWLPIVPVWGVVAEIELPSTPTQVLEEAEVAGVHAGEPATLFSVVPAGEALGSLGSTFFAEEPEPADWVEPLRAGGARFVPAVRDGRLTGTRACARPQSFDGRPLVGELRDGLWVAAGHGPWGISTGAATARIAADALLGRGDVPVELAASRFEA